MVNQRIEFSDIQQREPVLLERVRRGDEEAFGQLFDRYYAAVASYTYKLVKDEQASEDIAQDVFVRLWKTRANLDPGMPPQGLLITMAKRLALNELRKVACDRKARLHFWQEIQLARNIVDDQLQFTETMQLAQRAIAALPKRQQEVFQLSRYEGLSHEEIADTLNISKHTVNNLMVQALKTLRVALKGAWFLVFLLSIFER
ncbi:RNA polymerase sigma factor [Parapedobacter soli]|uniref:RNA polymerase sigma factor n=1 Tax=Parapedobacter soli TaxID=416955 RepID=UPI0021C5E5F3|nr:RNA polymerase sigma-70 factor [Parapedobacter soli]